MQLLAHSKNAGPATRRKATPSRGIYRRLMCKPPFNIFTLPSVLLMAGWMIGGNGEPLSSHSRSCVSGQNCVVVSIRGTGLGDGDTITVLKTCGTVPVPAGLPPTSTGRSLPATSAGTVFTWTQPLTLDGGEYRMCWCSVVSSCTTLSDYATDIGTLTITGPINGLTKTCVGGRLCQVNGVQGAYLRNSDSIMIMQTCGVGSGIDGFPNGAKSLIAALAGSEFGWGQTPIAARGGSYKICWCAAGFTCAQGSNFLKTIGVLTVAGPSGNLFVSCDVFAPCTWSISGGTQLSDGDRIMLLDSCGVGESVLGFPNSDIAVASGGGGSYSFGGDNVVTAGGGVYQMCWCRSGDSNVCTAPANFLVSAGALTLLGPRRDHVVSCVRGRQCRINNFTGVGLSDNDRIMILSNCGSGSAVGGLPNGGVLTASDAGQTFSSWGLATVAAASVTYRICWCKATWGCSSAVSFKADAGALRIVSVSSGQTRTCHADDGCLVQNIAGQNLYSGDNMLIMTSCGVADAVVSAWPLGGRSEPATFDGTQYTWGLLSRNKANPNSSYKMCWCPYAHFSGCTAEMDFLEEVGTMRLVGPTELGTNGTCSAYAVPACVVGQFLAGYGLTWGTDKVLLVGSSDPCRDGSRDVSVGGNTFGKLVANDGLVHWGTSDLPFGGRWKMCYCASYDSPLDFDTLPCSSVQDFPALAGILSVIGAYPGQDVNCTLNQMCTFDLFGYGLNDIADKVAISDRTSTCGQDISLDGATRRRRDITGNPYMAVSRVSSAQLQFTLNPVEVLGTFTICFCVPPPAGNSCGAWLGDYDQTVGILDIRGASPNQTFVCVRGGFCVLHISGRGLAKTDLIKIVNMSTDCIGQNQNAGFFRSILQADSTSTDILSTFNIGLVTATGSFKACYCASLAGCGSMLSYNHLAGILLVTDPLTNIVLVSATATYITVTVTSAITSPLSFISCAVAEYELTSMPDAFMISAGLGYFGRGKGQSQATTVAGDNTLRIFFNKLVASNHQYRVWCVEGSAQSFILPSHPGGLIVVTPGPIVVPHLRVFPSFLWTQANFYAESYNVYSEASFLSQGIQRTLARVGLSINAAGCRVLQYKDLNPMQVVTTASNPAGTVTLRTMQTLSASVYRPFICFFDSPNASGIAFDSELVIVQSSSPMFYPLLFDNSSTMKYYRGVLTRVILTHPSSKDGLLHWVPDPSSIGDCSNASRSPPDAQLVSNSTTSLFRLIVPSGFYSMCYLGLVSESTTAAPFNRIGDVFEVIDVITAIRQDSLLPSTRDTVRVEVEVRLHGKTTCIAKSEPVGASDSDFVEGTNFQGRFSVSLEPVPFGVDADLPRVVRVALPLLYEQRTIGPLYVFCQHSMAGGLVYPPSLEGAPIVLQATTVSVHSNPSFLWSGARFKISLEGTPSLNSKMVAMYAPVLPVGWYEETVLVDGAMVLRYHGPQGITDVNPVYAAYMETSEESSPCQGSNLSSALALSENGFTEMNSWFVAAAERPFVCYWASSTSFPHLVSVLSISAQPPEFTLEVDGDLRSSVYRGVDFTIHVQFGSSVGGRLFVIDKQSFESQGGLCLTDMARRRLDKELLQNTTEMASESRRLPSGDIALDRRVQQDGCTNSQRRTSDLKLISAHELFPILLWDQEADLGLNCSRDFEIYYRETLPNTSVLADEANRRFILVTTNETVVLHFVPRIRSLSPSDRLPNNTSAIVVLQTFQSISNVTAESWVLSNSDCVAQMLLSAASPMFLEGAENLPLQQYLLTAMELIGFDYFAVVFIPPSILTDAGPPISPKKKSDVCSVLQPPALPPRRPESPLDIDKPMLGRTVNGGVVHVPAMFNGIGSFLHYNDLKEYVICYLGDESVAPHSYNVIGLPFSSKDVLPLEDLRVPLTPMSTTAGAYLNVTSMIRGVVRCLALLRTANPPTQPLQILNPDTSALDYVASSDLVHFDFIGAQHTLSFNIDQSKAKFITSPLSSAMAQPTMYVWCAHNGSTLVFPSLSGGFQLFLQARPPPNFHYVQLNLTVTSLSLIVGLDFDPIIAIFESSNFLVNQYDTVRFKSSPVLPDGLRIDESTGAIAGIPTRAGNATRSIMATSVNPPFSSRSISLNIGVQDVLGLSTRTANVDNLLFTTRPQSTTLFKSEVVYILIKRVIDKFAGTPTEFFCILDPVQPTGVGSIAVGCRIDKGMCCCVGAFVKSIPVQDMRVSTASCGLAHNVKYHVAALVKGTLKTTQGTRTTGLLSSSFAQVNVPSEQSADRKRPVIFDLVLQMSLEEYMANEASNEGTLADELSVAVAIPRALVRAMSARPFFRTASQPTSAPTSRPAWTVIPSTTTDTNTTETSGARRLSDLMIVDIFFGVEPRCLEQVPNEIKLMSVIDTKQGCNHVAPEEYMTELYEQLSNSQSALFYRDDLPFLRRVSVQHSFSYRRVMYFCNREPIWLYGAVVEKEDQCPFDLLKMSTIGAIVATFAFTFCLGLLSYLSAGCASCSFLNQTRILDLLTPIMASYTSAAHYAWILFLKLSPAGISSAWFDTIFMVGLCHLFLCFIINSVALRITIANHIMDTPWWRRNRKRLTAILLLSAISPRFFRITRSSLLGIDVTLIHFGTPSKMAVVFSNLGLVSLFQDFPQLLLHIYVYVVWRNQGPRITLICVFLTFQSILTACLHHVFSRTQRAAYERVVRLLGVRRLTAGFFDVSSIAGQTMGGIAGSGIHGLVDNIKGAAKAGGEASGFDDLQLGTVVDPNKLDPIQAAMYVSQLYEKEARGKRPVSEENRAKSKQVYPKDLYERMKKFYTEHDPARLATIALGDDDVEVDEDKLDAELKKRFGVGLDSVD